MILAIECQNVPVAILARGLGNPWEAVGPVVAAAGDQAYAVAVALQVLPIANLFDFMEARRGGRDRGRCGRQAEFEGALHW
jgi:hypothetical protein